MILENVSLEIELFNQDKPYKKFNCPAPYVALFLANILNLDGVNKATIRNLRADNPHVVTIHSSDVIDLFPI